MAEKIARKARLELIYRGVDLGEHCLLADYTDHAHGQLDELCAHLEDRDRKWQGPWRPAKSEVVRAVIHCHDWFVPGDHLVLNCGEFEIQGICLSGPPDTVEIRAVSRRVSRNAQAQKKSKGWENVDLKAIAGAVAANAGLALAWEGNNPFYEREDQREESDMAFLRRLCLDAGNSIKIADSQLIVYSGKSFDQRGPHGQIKRGETWLIDYRFEAQSFDKYRGCEVSYWHPDLRLMIKGACFPADAPPTGEVLKINQEVKTEAEANALAASNLRRKNRSEVKADFTLMGDPRLRATQVQEVKGFGKYDGRYFVDEARQTVDGSGGYTTALKARKVISY
jgi:hypothetical protein